LDTPPQIYVKQLNDSAPVKLTDSHSNAIIGPLVWSPDGKWLAFKRGNKSSGAIFIIPSSGGNEKRILDLESPYESSRLDWSPDGKQLAFSDFLPRTERMALYLCDPKTGEKRRLTSPPADAAGDWNPKFSPDNRTIAFKRASGFWADDMYTVPVSGGEPRRVTWDRRGILGHVWTPDGKSLIVSCQRGATIFGLWRFSLASQSQPEQVVQSGVDAVTPAICWKTGRLAWVDVRQDLNIYRMSARGGQQPVKLIASIVRDQDPEYSPDGHVAFVSDRSGSREIWLARGDGTDQRRVTNLNGPDVGDLQWSPDGRRLAFYSRAQRHSDIFALDCDLASMQCENPKRLTTGMKAEVPSWSAAANFLYFASDRTGQWEIWKQAIPDGKLTQVTHSGGYASRESRDGKWLYFSKIRGYGIWRVRTQDGGHEELVIDPSENVQQKGWALTPEEILFTARAEDGRSAGLRAFRLSSRRTRSILGSMVAFADTRDYDLSVSPDLKWVLYPQLEESGSNIMLAESR
jgi:Tol biopolymer transport system component